MTPVPEPLHTLLVALVGGLVFGGWALAGWLVWTDHRRRP